MGGTDYKGGDVYNGTFADLFAAYPELKGKEYEPGKFQLNASALSQYPAFQPKVFYAGSYVEVRGGTIMGNVFAGSDGSGYYDLPEAVQAQIGKTPYMTGTGLVVRGGTFEGNLYGGGNQATVGYRPLTPSVGGVDETLTRSMAFVTLDNRALDQAKEPANNDIGGDMENAPENQTVINGKVYGGGRMASVYGSVDVLVREGVRVATVFAGNDISGSVVSADGRYGTRLTNPAEEKEYVGVARAEGLCPNTETTFNRTPIAGNTADVLSAYVRVLPGAEITGELYGGGNGYYNHSKPTDGKVYIYGVPDGEFPQEEAIEKPDDDSHIAVYPHSDLVLPEMARTWLDVKGRVETSYGSGSNAAVAHAHTYVTADARVTTAYGGGNFATAKESAIVDVECNVEDAVPTTPPADTELNIGTLFCGNNIADMDIVPELNLVSGDIGTVYGGGNQGDMTGARPSMMNGLGYFNDGTHRLDPMRNYTFKYISGITDESPHAFDTRHVPHFRGTNLVIDSDKLRIGTAYAGCRASNVDNSSFVRVSRVAYIGDVYGGCDITGSVGAKPHTAPAGRTVFYEINDERKTLSAETTLDKEMEMCNPSSYLLVTGSTISGNVYGAGNGDYYYELKDDGKTYVYHSGVTAGTAAGETPVAILTAREGETKVDVPWNHAATLRILGGTFMKNVYGGGNNARVGNEELYNEANEDPKKLESFYHAQSLVFLGGSAYGSDETLDVQGTVYGGSRRADVWGGIAILVKSGSHINTLYAGNDISGSIRGETRDGTGLYGLNMEDPSTCYAGVKLNQRNALVYVRVEPDATIGTLYGGGNGAYDESEKNPPFMQSSLLDIRGDVATIYGGGNRADIDRTNVYVTGRANVGTVFGGCNRASVKIFNVSSEGDVEQGMSQVVLAPFTLYGEKDEQGNPVKLEPTVTGDIFGGCNEEGGVNRLARVIVAGGKVGGNVYGGGRKANIVKGSTQVMILGGELAHNVYGGGLGEQDQDNGKTKDTYVYVLDDRLDEKGNLRVKSDKSGFDFVANKEEPWKELPRVTDLRGPVRIAGNVYGGGSAGTVTGQTYVQIGSEKPVETTP